MARAAKDAANLQVFRGSKTKPDVFALANGDCCTPNSTPTFDKLGDRVRFDNALAHENPQGCNEKFQVPGGNGFSGVSREIIDHINANGVGATVSVIAIPTFAYLKRVAVAVLAEESGLTFNLITRNGLVLPTTQVDVDTIDAGDDVCAKDRTHAAGNAGSFNGFGALDDHEAIYIFGNSAIGNHSLEADELILEVATMPGSGLITGTFDIRVAASYDVPHRAEA